MQLLLRSYNRTSLVPEPNEERLDDFESAAVEGGHLDPYSRVPRRFQPLSHFIRSSSGEGQNKARWLAEMFDR